MMGLLDDCGARTPDEAALLADPGLAAADPGLESLVNLNTLGDLAALSGRADQFRRENATRVPAAPSSSSRSQASAVAPASEATE